MSEKEDEKVCNGFSRGCSRLTSFVGYCCSDQETSHSGTTAEETKAKSSRGAVADQAQGDGQSEGVLFHSSWNAIIIWPLDRRRRQAVFISPGSDGTL